MDVSTPVPGSGAIAQPALVWIRNVQTPGKYGRPGQDRCILSKPTCDLYVRDHDGIMDLFDALAPAYAAAAAIETPVRKQQVVLDTLRAAGTNIHTSDTSENWPGAEHQKSRARKGPLTIEEIMERNGASAATTVRL